MHRSLRSSLCRLSAVSLISILIISLPSSPSQALTWDFWNQLFKSPPPVPISRGGSRGPYFYFCQITPDRDGNVLGNRPTLVWKGTVKRVELINAGEDILWIKDMTTATPLSSRIVDSGRETYQVTANTALEPGQLYRWRIYETYYASRVRDTFLTIPFQVISIQEREKLDLPKSELASIERADIFAKANLWSDFWREVLSIDPPTAEVNRMVDNTFAQLCPLIETTQHLNAKAVPSSPQPYENYAFEGQPGQTIDIALESDDFQPQVEVLSPQGTVLPKEAVTGERRFPSAESTSTRFQTMALVTLPDRGTYQIRVKASNGEAGQYGLRAVWRW